ISCSAARKSPAATARRALSSRASSSSDVPRSFVLCGRERLRFEDENGVPPALAAVGFDSPWAAGGSTKVSASGGLELLSSSTRALGDRRPASSEDVALDGTRW